MTDTKFNLTEQQVNDNYFNLIIKYVTDRDSSIDIQTASSLFSLSMSDSKTSITTWNFTFEKPIIDSLRAYTLDDIESVKRVIDFYSSRSLTPPKLTDAERDKVVAQDWTLIANITQNSLQVRLGGKWNDVFKLSS